MVYRHNFLIYSYGVRDSAEFYFCFLSNFRFLTMDKKVSTVQILLDFIRFLLGAALYKVYCGLYEIVTALQGVLDRVMFRSGHPYETSARLGNIFLKGKISVIDITSPRDFLCLYWARVHPEYVLKPNVSLYNVTENEAVFVESAPEVNIYSSDESPFLWMAQFRRSKKVIKMPMKSFHRLAENIGNPKVPVIWLSNVGRCGSTILCQVFESVPGTLIMAENDAPSNLAYIRKSNKLTKAEYTELFKSTYRLLLKPQPRTERFAIKPRAFAVNLMTDVSELFPDTKHIFIYRNSLEQVSSFLAILVTVPITVALRVLIDNETYSTIFPYFRKVLQNYSVFKLDESVVVPLSANTVGVFTHMWANFILLARDAMSHDEKILPIKFEEILAEPLKTCKLVFEHTGIDMKHLDAAVATFNRDSQRGSVISRSLVANDPRRRISAADRVKADAILRSYNLPCMGEDFTF